MPRKFVIPIAVVTLVLVGCAAQIEPSMRICPGKQSVAESLDVLRLRSQNAVVVKANGRCLLRYYDADGKGHKENFTVKLWMNPPAEIYLQGDIAFDAKGIVLGSNEEQFWLAMRPKEISSYWWGTWEQSSYLDKLIISPKSLLEAFGTVAVDSNENLSLSNEGGLDVLTRHNEQGIVSKKIYIDTCDYRVRRIEYFDTNGGAVVITELEKYKEVSKGFFAPSVIKIANRLEQDKADSFTIRFGSIKQVNLAARQRELIFTRPEPKGFKHVYKIIAD